MQRTKILIYVTCSLTFCVPLCKSAKIDPHHNINTYQCLTEYIKKFLSSQPLTLVQQAEAPGFVEELFTNNIPITIRNFAKRQDFGQHVFSNRKHLTVAQVSETMFFEYDKAPNSNYIFLINALKPLYQIAQELTSETCWNSQAKYLVILIPNEESDQAGTTEVLQVLLDHFIYNVVFTILNSEGNSSSFYTWYPYKNENGCDRKVLEAEHLGSCKLNFEDPYKDKIPRNLNKCPIIMGWYSIAGVEDVFNFRALEGFAKHRNATAR